MRSRGRRRREGLSALETCAIICVGGTVLAVVGPTFLSHVRASKLSEAPTMLADIEHRAASYYSTHRTLPDSAGPTPNAPVRLAVEVDFSGPGAAGSPTWRAFGISAARVRYAYSFTGRPGPCDGPPAPENSAPTLPRHDPEPELRSCAVFRAEGDLDGDGVWSRFERVAEGNGTALVSRGPLYVERRVE